MELWETQEAGSPNGETTLFSLYLLACGQRDGALSVKLRSLASSVGPGCPHESLLQLLPPSWQFGPGSTGAFSHRSGGPDLGLFTSRPGRGTETARWVSTQAGYKLCNAWIFTLPFSCQWIKAGRDFLCHLAPSRLERERWVDAGRSVAKEVVRGVRVWERRDGWWWWFRAKGKMIEISGYPTGFYIKITWVGYEKKTMHIQRN